MKGMCGKEMLDCILVMPSEDERIGQGAREALQADGAEDVSYTLKEDYTLLSTEAVLKVGWMFVGVFVKALPPCGNYKQPK